MSDPRHSITIVGLGPGELSYLTLEASDILQKARRIYVRTNRHPTVEKLAQRFDQLDVHSFDDIYETRKTFDEVYGGIVSRLMQMAREEDVIYCVPGSPSVDETTVRLLSELGSETGITVRTIQGLSFIEVTLAAVSGWDTSWTCLLDAVEVDLLSHQNPLGEIPGHSGSFPIRTPITTAPVLFSQLYSDQVAASVKLWMGRFWPEDHIVCLVRSAGTTSQSVTRIPLYQLDRVPVDHLTSLFVPPLQVTDDIHTFDGLLNVTRRLRAPGGCPWDREQTHKSLKPHLIEEAYEVIEALDQLEPERLSEELGDLLFQVTIHAQVAHESGDFDIHDVIASITRKLIRRHPHVFGDLNLPTSADVLERWESFKDTETPSRTSVLGGIPTSMPALPYSQSVQRRAANQKFDWPNLDAVLDKAEEELGELRLAVKNGEGRERSEEELGDLLFVLVSVARWLSADAEEALRGANHKFVRRFQFMESGCRERGERLTDLSAAQLDSLWEAAKRQARSD